MPETCIGPYRRQVTIHGPVDGNTYLQARETCRNNGTIRRSTVNQWQRSLSIMTGGRQDWLQATDVFGPARYPSPPPRSKWVDVAKSLCELTYLSNSLTNGSRPEPVDLFSVRLRTAGGPVNVCVRLNRQRAINNHWTNVPTLTSSICLHSLFSAHFPYTCMIMSNVRPYVINKLWITKML